MRAVIAILPACLPVGSVDAKYGRGSGTAEDPYQIHTSQQMNGIGTNPDDWDKHFMLMADGSLGSYPINSFHAIGEYVERDSSRTRPFAGVSDGNGKVIRNFDYLCLACKDVNDVGLFRYVAGPVTGRKRSPWQRCPGHPAGGVTTRNFPLALPVIWCVSGYSA